MCPVAEKRLHTVRPVSEAEATAYVGLNRDRYASFKARTEFCFLLPPLTDSNSSNSWLLILEMFGSLSLVQ